MSKPLLPRELCRFRIENDEITVTEKHLDDVLVRDFRFDCGDRAIVPLRPEEEPPIQWLATIPDPTIVHGEPLYPGHYDVEIKERIVAYAYLHGEGPDVEFFMIVHPDYRSQGLGTVMLRMATDLAIRYHKKVITCEVPDGALRSTKTFEREGFDFTRDDMAARAIGRKEIR